ncbi:hypothetical protein PtA15_12A493 [Puccinia triticina]|uniref:C2H2-type domain-containing protein n=1 Tax=Puccinia triticina TaxID=208348 RepID=A0ABY7CYW7_9BASI|nr:uncharacterized protein PtA15_12A493 [Puccinia triticina]WAQ90503.1 hypothetical protein PtA15_12A493 [Puccinia triticina]
MTHPSHCPPTMALRPTDEPSSTPFRHHRHPSNASESSANSLPLENGQQESCTRPASFVDEPLPMEGHFATMDLHSSPSQLSSYLPAPPAENHPFRYDTLTWAKEHPPFPDPQDTILATAGIYPKQNSLASILDPLNPHDQQALHSYQQNTNSSPDRPASAYLNPQQQAALDENNTPQIPTITTHTIPSNPTSPLLRLNMNHPAMPTGPSISLTSATPLTAKPSQQIPNLFNDHALAGSSSQSNTTDTLLQSLINNNNSNNNDLFQSLVSHPRTTSQNSQHQHNPFLSPRPVRARQRSKSESMGNQQSMPIGTDPLKSFFSSANPPPPITHRQTTLGAQLLQASSPSDTPPSRALESQGQIIQQLTDSSYLQELLEEFTAKKQPADLAGPSFQSMLRPANPLHHRRSHSVSHPAGHRRGRSDAGPMATPFDAFIPQLFSPASSSQQAYAANALSPHHTAPSLAAQQGLLLPDSGWSFRSKTTAATKAAAIRRRKVGVAARYICEMCGESFTRRYNLRGHQRAHKGEKPFACGYPGCTSRFARAHDQKRHYKLHLGVKDYSCPVCQKTFIRLDALQRHHKSDAGQACFQELQQLASSSGTTIAGICGLEKASEFENTGAFDGAHGPPGDLDETPGSASFGDPFGFHQQQQQHLAHQQHALDPQRDHSRDHQHQQQHIHCLASGQ